MKSFQQFNEVAPPGWGHTKAEKEKTDPSKPKSKIGGTIAAMKRAQDRGDIPKKLNIFALAYSMKNKGANPHYIPGTKEKYKKYQEEDKKDVRLKKEGQSSFSDKSNTFTQEETSMPNVSKKDRGAIKKRFSGLFKKDIKGTVQGVNEGALHNKMDTFKSKAVKRRDDNALGTISSATKRYELLKKLIGSKKKHDKPAIKK